MYFFNIINIFSLKVYLYSKIGVKLEIIKEIVLNNVKFCGKMNEEDKKKLVEKVSLEWDKWKE